MTNNTTTTWIITTSLPGAFLAEGEPEPFETTTDEAITALLDEADFQLEYDLMDDCENEVREGDRALVESLRGHEGRGDLLFNLNRHGAVTIHLESLYNSFGGIVTLSNAE